MLTTEEMEMIAIVRSQEETAEDRNQRIAQRAAQLKADREAERKAFVDAKLEERWRSSVDELRQADAKLWQLETLSVIEQQINEKKTSEQREQEENQVYEAMWQEDYREKLAWELREREARAASHANVKKILDSQVAQKELMRNGSVEIETGKGGGLLAGLLDKASPRTTKVSMAAEADRLRSEMENRKRELEEQKKAERDENNRIVKELISVERDAVANEAKQKEEQVAKMKAFIAQQQMYVDRAPWCQGAHV